MCFLYRRLVIRVLMMPPMLNEARAGIHVAQFYLLAHLAFSMASPLPLSSSLRPLLLRVMPLQSHHSFPFLLPPFVCSWRLESLFSCFLLLVVHPCLHSRVVPFPRPVRDLLASKFKAVESVAYLRHVASSLQASRPWVFQIGGLPVRPRNSTFPGANYLLRFDCERASLALTRYLPRPRPQPFRERFEAAYTAVQLRRLAVDLLIDC